MTALTVGQVSAVIAAIIFVFQFLVPNAVTLILVGILRQSHSAVTWSVVQRNIFSSHWPLFLNNDAVAARGVDPKIRWITYMKPIGLALISLAAIITPLGLHDSILPSSDTDQVPFGHLADSGPFGYATMARNGQHFTRTCSGNGVPLPCPGSNTQIDFTYNNIGQITNGTVKPGTTYDVNVPQSLIDLYQSGLVDHPDSVASFFDIESRVYTYTNRSDQNNGTKYVVDTFRMLQSIILDDVVQPIDGLIVDAHGGGVGFRNHSVPSSVGLGAEWVEDILFIEPETECVNTNLTYQFTIGEQGPSRWSLEDLALVDDGGFVNIDHTYPEIDMSNPQKNAHLRDRAYKAAWLTNVWTMLFMNVTRPNPKSFAYLNSKLGQQFPLTTDLTSFARADGIGTTGIFANMVDPGYGTMFSSNTSLSNTSSIGQSLYANPFNMSLSNYSLISTVCEGAGGIDLANATNIHIACGLVFGAAWPVDGQDVTIPFPSTKWRQPIYTCASALKASIKQVWFHYNTSLAHDLSALSVLNITENNYKDETAMPLWGIENVDFQLNQIQQLWGIISQENANAPNITTFRAPFMRLPGFYSTLTNQLKGYSYIPGHEGPNQALSGIYDTTNGPYDWTGEINIAMLKRWRQLTNTTDGAAHIANLIWTDIAANKMTSSTNWNNNAAAVGAAASSSSLRMRKRDEQQDGGRQAAVSTGDGTSKLVPVITFARRVQYNWVYAIPAIATLVVVGLLMITAVLMSIINHAGAGHVRYFMNNLSSGRLLAAQQHPGVGVVDKHAPTGAWLSRAGKLRTTLDPMESSSGWDSDKTTNAMNGQQYGRVPGYMYSDHQGYNHENADTSYSHELAQVHREPGPAYQKLGAYGRDDNDNDIKSFQTSYTTTNLEQR